MNIVIRPRSFSIKDGVFLFRNVLFICNLDIFLFQHLIQIIELSPQRVASFNRRPSIELLIHIKLCSITETSKTCKTPILKVKNDQLLIEKSTK